MVTVGKFLVPGPQSNVEAGHNEDGNPYASALLAGFVKVIARPGAKQEDSGSDSDEQGS